MSNSSSDDPTHPPAQRTPLGFADHSRFSDLQVKLAYGQLSDGRVVHVSEVVSGLGCGCVCPACGDVLVARKGPRKTNHFAHHTKDCGYGRETNAHQTAKNILAKIKRIALPAVEASYEGRHRADYAARIYEFDSVVLERRLGLIVPDVLLKLKDRELIVEVLVTHRCDDVKIARIRELGIATIEVDLSALHTSYDEAAIEKAFLFDAPRTWLFNPKVDEIAEELKREHATVLQQAAEDLARRTRAVAAALRPSRTPGRCQDDIAAVKRRLRMDLVGIGNATGGFRVPMRDWQAAIYNRVVIADALKPVGSVFELRDVLRRISNCIEPMFQTPLQADVAAALVQDFSDTRHPHDRVAEYLQELEVRGVIESPYGGYSVTEQERDGLQKQEEKARELAARQETIPVRVKAILAQLRPDELGDFDFVAWQMNVPGFGMSFDAILSDDMSAQRFGKALGILERMLGGGRAATDLMGLPFDERVAFANMAEDHRREAEEREREAKVRRAQEQRREHMRDRAQRALHADAGEWLQRRDADGLTPLDHAASESPARSELYDQLDRLAVERRRQRRADRLAADCRAQLQVEARRAFAYDDRLGPIFLQSGHPQLEGKSPLSHCVDELTLRECLALLPQQRRRR